MKKITKQLLCAVLTLVIVLSFAACGSNPSLEGGNWHREDNWSAGFHFREMQEMEDGREMGLVDMKGMGSTLLTSYYYYFSGENEITILERVTRITSNTVKESVYAVLELTEEDGQKVLTNQESGTRFLFAES